jgi:alanyl-tRNA synthetase
MKKLENYGKNSNLFLILINYEVTLIYLVIKNSLPEDHILKGNMKDNFWEMVT